MKHKKEFIKMLNTLFHSWGGDTPPEAYWAGNELLEWLEKEYKKELTDPEDPNSTLKVRFDEMFPESFDCVIRAINDY